MRAIAIGLIIALLSTLPAAAASAQKSWLPPHVEEGFAQQLAERMKLLGGGEPRDPEGLLEGSRRIIRSMRGVVESWDEAGVLERAPRFPELEVPTSGNRILDAMAAYQICNMILYLQLHHPDFEVDDNGRLTSILGLSSLTMALISLRQPLLDSGRSMEDIEPFLAGPELEVINEGIQGDADVRSHVEAQCQPVVRESLEEPLEEMSRMAGGGR